MVSQKYCCRQLNIVICIINTFRSVKKTINYSVSKQRMNFSMNNKYYYNKYNDLIFQN